jgi:hypothetical protein
VGFHDSYERGRGFVVKTGKPFGYRFTDSMNKDGSGFYKSHGKYINEEFYTAELPYFI